ncbi:MAG: YkvA family protein [Nitriliruptorales bacterium]|nr:YkvA family protein [Nitriliruptorales bacterium]
MSQTRMSSTGGPGQRTREREAWRELLHFLPDVARLLYALMRDDRVPVHAKVVAGGAVAYVVSPVDLIPDFLGVIGQMDDMLVVSRALRFLAQEAGYDVLHELWPGSEDGFALLLVVAGIER